MASSDILDVPCEMANLEHLQICDHRVDNTELRLDYYAYLGKLSSQ